MHITRRFFFPFLFNQAVADPPPGGGTPPPPPPAASPFGPKGELADNWHVPLGDEFAPHAPTLSRFKDVGSLAKSYMELRTSGPAYPDEKASPEQVSRFRTLAKVPETVEGYGIAKPAELPPGVEFDEAATAKYLEVAHKHHVSAPALQALMATMMELEGGRAATAAQAAAAAERDAQDALVREFGSNYDPNLSTVRHLTEKLASAAGIVPTDAEGKTSPELKSLLDNPAFVRMAFAFSKQIGEDGIRPPGGHGDLRSAQQQADAIMDGKDPVWGEKYRSGDPAAYTEVSRLLQAAKR